eukprot:CAMPEP_0197587928 /NCGR_PEP_ID=MMETSP1326-20131121/9384_1 /TAXON_ID=1155430 /ORGANISM="Genus nov. species nov., Strain RCC2288" /LENGTH=152 /DNA_ID=CAMNT_0043152703 /DNA_START=17 /DNA_END=472 /DNA_ORIENTATION=+
MARGADAVACVQRSEVLVEGGGQLLVFGAGARGQLFGGPPRGAAQIHARVTIAHHPAGRLAHAVPRGVRHRAGLHAVPRRPVFVLLRLQAPPQVVVLAIDPPQLGEQLLHLPRTGPVPRVLERQPARARRRLEALRHARLVLAAAAAAVAAD